jgi:hypothetical protein
VIIATVVGTALIVAITIAIGVYADRKLHVQIQPVPTLAKLRGHAVGEAPSTAIRAGAAQLANLRASQRCTECRALLEADVPDDAIRYAERNLLVIHFQCPACVRKRSLYVEPI